MVVLGYDASLDDVDGLPWTTLSDTPFFGAAPTAANGAGEAVVPDAERVRAHSEPVVNYYFPKGVGHYHYGERHPMKPARLTLTNRLVLGYGLHEHMDGLFSPSPASREEIEAFHDPDYIQFLATVTPSSPPTAAFTRFNFADDCPVFDGMYEFCRSYAGASLAAARKLNTGTTDIAINWSGGLHHAKKSEASGFCYINDIVLAIMELLRHHPRVLYIDIDVHHGDGVQEAFYNSNRVFTVSFHKYGNDFFPCTGALRETGVALGKHFCMNVPLADGVDDASYVALFKAILEPIVNTFDPAAIVLQCGADSLGNDRLGCFNLSVAAHGECVRFVRQFGIPLMTVGGGGYTVRNVARCWTYETAVLLNKQVPDQLPHTEFDSFFLPSKRLHEPLRPRNGQGGRLENQNTRASLEKIRIACLDNLRYLHGAPSVQMHELPPDLHGTWLEEEADGDPRADK